MKVEKLQTVFQPFIITVETLAEAQLLTALVGHCTQDVAGKVCGPTNFRTGEEIFYALTSIVDTRLLPELVISARK